MQPNMMPGMPNQNLYAMMNQQRQNMMGGGMVPGGPGGPGGMNADNYPMGQQNSPAHNAPSQSPMPPSNIPSSAPGGMGGQGNPGPPPNSASAVPPGHSQPSGPNNQSVNAPNMKNNSFSQEMLQVNGIFIIFGSND